MDWNSCISTSMAVLSTAGGAFAYYQANLSKKAKTKVIEERKLAEQQRKELLGRQI